jgi:hypothetical protein
MSASALATHLSSNTTDTLGIAKAATVGQIETDSEAGVDRVVLVVEAGEHRQDGAVLVERRAKGEQACQLFVTVVTQHLRVEQLHRRERRTRRTEDVLEVQILVDAQHRAKGVFLLDAAETETRVHHR